MSRVNEQGYVETKFIGKKHPNSKGSFRHEFLIGLAASVSYWKGKRYENLKAHPVNLGSVAIPKEYIGKRVRFKLEVVK